jgi:hypothetical protein
MPVHVGDVGAVGLSQKPVPASGLASKFTVASQALPALPLEMPDLELEPRINPEAAEISAPQGLADSAAEVGVILVAVPEPGQQFDEQHDTHDHANARKADLELEQHVAEQQAMIAKLQAEVAELRADNSRSFSLLVACESELHECKANHARREETGSLQEDVYERQSALDAREQELNMRDQDVSRREAQLSQQKVKLDQLSDELSLQAKQPRRGCCRQWLLSQGVCKKKQALVKVSV